LVGKVEEDEVECLGMKRKAGGASFAKSQFDPLI
jgi:hypothetical protein